MILRFGVSKSRVSTEQWGIFGDQLTYHVDEMVEFGLCYLNSHYSNGMKLQYVKIQRIASNNRVCWKFAFVRQKGNEGQILQKCAPFSVVRRVGLQVVFSHSLVLL